MKQQFDSVAERDAAPIITQLGGKRCTSFAPLLETSYLDASGAELEGRPDFLIQRDRCYTFIETKAGKLNYHRTRESSHDALKEAHRLIFHRCPDTLGYSYSQLSKILHDDYRGRMAVLDHAWNHSVFKLAAMQAKYGWQRYLVVFKKAPTKKDAARYLKAGLVFCTVDTLPRMMTTIELLQHGWRIPFVFRNRSYSFTVEADPETKGLTSAQVEKSDRAKFLTRASAF